MKMKKRVFLLVLTALVLAAMLFAATEPRHECSGDGCPVCYFMSLCRNLFKTLCAAVLLCALRELMPAYEALKTVIFRLHPARTPVILKVKLSN